MLLGLVGLDAGTARFDGRVYEDLEHPSSQVGAVLEDASFHPGRSGRNHLRILAAAGDHPRERVDAGARDRRHRRRRQPARQGLLDGDAPAAGDRGGAARRPRGADPRRARQRPRPARHPLDARHAARRGGARPGGAGLEPPALRGVADRRRRRRDLQGRAAGERAPERRSCREPRAAITRVKARDTKGLGSGAPTRPASPSTRTPPGPCSSAASTREAVGAAANEHRVALERAHDRRALARGRLPRADRRGRGAPAPARFAASSAPRAARRRVLGLRPLLLSELIKLRTTRTFWALAGVADRASRCS